MTTSVGTLTIDMAANIVRLQKDMHSARTTVESTMDRISKATKAAGAVLGGLGLAVGLGSLANFVKSAINAADETAKLAQRVGVTVPQIAGLQLAFSQSGVAAGALQTSMARLSTGIFEGNKAFDALGISTKNADGTLKNTRQILGEVADKFKNYEDGAGKTALAIQLFGRAGADLIPLLNGGSRALDDFDAMAEKLGLTLTKETAQSAERFNDTLDLMGKGFKGITMQVAAAMLPTLEALTDQFFTAMTEGDRLKRIGDALATGFRALVVVFIGLSSVLEGVTDSLSSFGRIMLAVMQGDFKGAINIGNTLSESLRKNWTGALADMDKAWNANGSQAVSTMTITAKAYREQAPVVNAETQKMVKESEKLDATYTKLINGIEDKTGAMILESQGTEKLTDAQKTALKTMQDIQDGTLKLNDAQKIKLTQSLEELLRTEALNEEMKKQAESYKKVTKEIDDKTLALADEQEGTEKLSSTQKLALKIMQDIQSGTLQLNDAQKIKITQDLEQLINTERLNAANKDLQNTQAAAIALSNKLNDEQDKQTESIRENVIKLMEQNDELRYGKEAVAQRQIAVMRATAADLEFASTMVEGNEHLAEQARLLRQQADLAEDNSMLSAAKGANAELEKTTQSISTIESSLTDALMRGFESGKDFGKNLADTLVNMFKTLVLKPIIQPIAQGGANMILSLMGMALPGSAAAGGGGGAASMMQGLQLSMSAFGSTMGTGFMNTIFGTGGSASMTAAQSMISGGHTAAGMGMGAGTLAGYGAGAAAGVFAGRAISGGYAVSGSGNGMVNAGTAVGMVLGGPIGAAIGGAIAGGVNRLFGRKQTDMGIEGTLTTAEGIEGTSYQFLKGGLFRSSKTITSALASEVEVMFDSSIELITKQTRHYAAALGLPADAIDSFTQKIKLSFQGLSEEEINQKIADTLAEFQEGLASQYASALEPLKMAGETFTQTLQRLIAIQDVSIYLNEFGGAFSNFATASITARQGIIELAGGLDALVQKTQGFVANFYSKEEQAGITARGIVVALETAGFSASQIAALETRADFRTLLESIDVSTDIGQQQFVALLDLQAAYSATVPIMEEQSATLLAIAEAAPQIEILQKMFETDAEYQDRVMTAEQQAQEVFNDLLATMGTVDISINNLTNIMAGRLDRLATDMATVQAQANAAAASAIAVANASAAAAIAAAAAAAAAAEAPQDMSGYGAAMGGFIDGPTLVGEHGPEIFNPRTSQIFTAPATTNIFGGNEMTAEIRALRDEVSMMRHETRSTAVNTAKIFRLQDNWDVRGLTVKTDVDQPLDTVTV
jgi:hypothetical protein